jgi:hypothetical protein
MSNILIVGMSPDRVPAWKDKYDAIYALPWDDEATPYATRLFEMHDRALVERRGCDYVPQLNRQEVPIVMQHRFGDIRYSEGFPWECVPTCLRYVNSSIAYMMIWAIRANATRIALTGCALTDGEEYSYQRPNMEYLIGYARGLGIEVEVLGESSLLRFHPNIMFLDEMQTYKERYGYL